VKQLVGEVQATGLLAVQEVAVQEAVGERDQVEVVVLSSSRGSLDSLAAQLL
jgi:methylmalonyl-CoA mutase cobalamin-binding subunit